MDIKHPEVRVRLSGNDGNAYAIMGATRRALERARVPREEIEEYLAEAKSGDYDHLLITTMKTVTVE